MLTHASENWTINLSDRKKTAKMRFLCPVAGYTSLGQKWSTDILSEIKIFTLTERTERQTENWYECILRMTTDRLPKMYQEPRGQWSMRWLIARQEGIFLWCQKLANGLYPWRRNNLFQCIIFTDINCHHSEVQ